ncbi:MAG: HEAT repeat domain-containing protein [Anaerolineae bacterium]|jgi:HEAT repeat protein
MATRIEIVLDSLRENGEEPDQALLCYLSSLSAEQAERVGQVWPDLPTDLRLELTSRLVRMAEADFTLSFGAIFRIGMEDDNAEVRKLAIEGLWEDEDVRLVPLLAQCLGEDESVSVRAAAAQSLGRFILLGELGKIRPKPRRMAYRALLQSLQAGDEHTEVRRRALESLAYVCNETVVASIREAYGSSSEKFRISAVFAMGRSADTRWDEEVQQQLFSTNPEMRYEAARACGELQLSEAVDMLEELTGDADAEVQQGAIWALGQVGGERAREILEHYCRVGDEALQSAAEAAIEEFEFLHGDLEDLFADLFGEPDW